MLYSLIRSFLFRLDPETAHALIMNNIDWAAAVRATRLVCPAPVSHPVEVMGLRFPNAVGLAAGMDKTAAHVSSLGSLGFGHIEVGTITPRPQAGNPKPRCWRLIPAKGIVNHMGFNNCGADKAIENLVSAKAYRAKGGIVGINIGKQNSTAVADALPDYVECMKKLTEHADYLAIDISCPNTPGLTRLQEADALEPLVAGIAAERDRQADRLGRRVPITIKIGPDLADETLKRVADLHLEKSQNPGGLSGKPLFERSTEVVRILADHLKDELPIIAVGGVMTAEDAVAKMEAGASLVQLYTGFIYSGPALIAACAEAIGRRG